jgi:hypothetical protein
MTDRESADFYTRRQAAITAEIERLIRAKGTPIGLSDKQWNTHLRNQARLTLLDARRKDPNE